MSEQGPPAGWYPHPQMANTLQYWNGSSFTGDLAPTTPPNRPVVASGEVSDTVQTIGWICAFIVPIVGFVIGCLCVSQGPKDEGIWMIVISVIFAVGAFLLLSQSASLGY